MQKIPSPPNIVLAKYNKFTVVYRVCNRLGREGTCRNLLKKKSQKDSVNNNYIL